MEFFQIFCEDLLIKMYFRVNGSFSSTLLKEMIIIKQLLYNLCDNRVKITLCDIISL